MVYTTSIFDKQLATLTKKPKDGYSECLTDIKNVICLLTFIEICNLDDVITRTNENVLRKVRIPNSEQNWGKSQGYRLILLCNIVNEKVYLLFVYPKKGKLESSDLTSKGAEILITQYDNIKAGDEVFSFLCEKVG